MAHITYKPEKWKWVLKFTESGMPPPVQTLIDKVCNNHLHQVYCIDKPPKSLPCRKKCAANAFCLTSISRETKSTKELLTQSIRYKCDPVGLENTANTCWINSALQALYAIQDFRNCINSIDGFNGKESLTSFAYLLQAMFVEMDLYRYKAISCHPGSVFEKLAVYASKEVMQKDADFEMLKCVSEFLENTIDKLIADPRATFLASKLFKTTLSRVAKWKCSSCQKENVLQLPSDSCYTMAAYVSGDECPLHQCILDLQTETQTGVSLVCAEKNGCGSRVTADRVVTPQLLTLPSLLIIRNNSLIDKELKKRLHVVYSETLDLTQYAINGEIATYSLRAVIYHHGHWIKHFSAHVSKEDGKWFNFNDEKVSPLEARTGNAPPLETNKNYFSLPSVANKYQKKSGTRVSRGAFIWIYQKRDPSLKRTYVPPPESVVDFMLSDKKEEKLDDSIMEQVKVERQNILNKLALESQKEDFCVVSHGLLFSWYNFGGPCFVPQPQVLSGSICQHGRFDPMLSSSIKLVKKKMVNELLENKFGIRSTHKQPVVYGSDEAFCRDCVARHAHHLLFKDYIKSLQKEMKKMASKNQKSCTTFVGSYSMSRWAKLALSRYWRENGFESDSSDRNSVKLDSCGSGDVKDEANESPMNRSTDLASLNSEIESDENVISRFNEEIACEHGFISPQVPGLYLPKDVVDKISVLCGVHNNSSSVVMEICNKCLSGRNKILETCESGRKEKAELCQLFYERRRPHPGKDAGANLFLLSRDFLSEWRTFVRMCMKDDVNICRPLLIENSGILCSHRKLRFRCTFDDESPMSSEMCVVFEKEWNNLKEYYEHDVSLLVKYNEEGLLVSEVQPCTEGCLAEELKRIFESQFVYDRGLINIRQVNSESDVPRLLKASEEINSEHLPKKRQKTEPVIPGNGEIGSSSLRAATNRRVRASKMFCSSDTIKEVQNFIAGKTGIWPFLQTLWLSGGGEHGPQPLLLNDQQRSMTLSALRIKPGDTVYFRAAKEDLEKAAGDGETEYDDPQGYDSS